MKAQGSLRLKQSFLFVNPYLRVFPIAFSETMEGREGEGGRETHRLLGPVRPRQGALKAKHRFPLPRERTLFCLPRSS